MKSLDSSGVLWTFLLLVPNLNACCDFMLRRRTKEENPLGMQSTGVSTESVRSVLEAAVVSRNGESSLSLDGMPWTLLLEWQSLIKTSTKMPNCSNGDEFYS
nr:hypothetical protein CFP56_43768 [Quercus suber]